MYGFRHFRRKTVFFIATNLQTTTITMNRHFVYNEVKQWKNVGFKQGQNDQRSTELLRR